MGAFDDGAEDLFLVVVEVLDGFEVEAEVAVGAAVVDVLAGNVT